MIRVPEVIKQKKSRGGNYQRIPGNFLEMKDMNFQNEKTHGVPRKMNKKDPQWDSSS